MAQYLALNNQGREEGRVLRALALLGRLSGPGLAAVVLLVGPQAPLALLQRLPLLRGVVGRALALLLGVAGAVLGVGQRGSDPAAGVPSLPPEPRDVSLQQAALDDAVGLLGRGDRRETDVRSGGKEEMDESADLGSVQQRVWRRADADEIQ